MSRSSVRFAMVAVAVSCAALTACGGRTSHAVAPATTATATSGSTSPTSATSGAPTTTAPVSPSATPTGGINGALAPAPASPALKQWNVATVTQALKVAREVAIAGISDETVLTRKNHPIADFAAVTQYLSPAAMTTFDQQYAAGMKGDSKALDYIFALTWLGEANQDFIPDLPITFASQSVNINNSVGLDNSTVTHPEMTVTGTSQVGFVGTLNGTHGSLVASRGFKIALSETGDPTQPVAVDYWDGNFATAKTVVPLK